MGSVIGISTDKLHTRGPVGQDELTTYKAGVLKRSYFKVEALEEFITITKLATGYGEAWKEKGVVEGLIARKIPKGSRPAWLPDGYDSLKRAMMLIPEDFDVWSSLGGVLKNVRGDLAPAQQMYAHAANISDGHPYPLLNALKLEARDTGKLNLVPVREQLEKAAKLRLAQALTMPPTDTPWCYFDLAEINLYQGNKKGFMDYVKKGIESCNASWQPETFLDSLHEALVDKKDIVLDGLSDGIDLLVKAIESYKKI